MKSLILTEISIALTLLALGAVGGYSFNNRAVIARAQEVLQSSRIQFDASDLTYIAVGEKQK